MTPSVAAASPNVAPAAPFAVVSTAAHDRKWWAAEATRCGTDWEVVVEGCRDLLAVGTNNKDDTFERACRDADRKATSRPEDPRILRARRLLADDVSYERAYAEFMRERPTPEEFASTCPGHFALLEPTKNGGRAFLSSASQPLLPTRVAVL
jgi:hypothetical protein